MGYQGNYPPSTPLTSSQIGAGAVTPTSLSSIGPYWDASGNVGIGTTSPSGRLNVVNNLATVEERISTTQNAYAELYLNTWALDRARIRAEAANPGAGSGAGSGALSFWVAQNPTMTEAMRIDGSGNVGIGTTTPFGKLDVKSQINVTNSSNGSMLGIKGTNFGYSSSYQVVQVGDSSGNNTVSLGYDPAVNTNGAFSGNGSEIITRDGIKFIQPNGTTAWYLNTLVFSGGNVGIGTSSPAQKLTVIGTGTPTIRIEETTSGGNKRLEMWVDSATAIANIGANQSGQQLAFQTINSERMRIDTSGNLLVGTSSALSNTAKVQINGGSGSTITSETSGTAATDHVNFRNGNGKIGTITTNGTATSYNTSSDYRLKHSVAPMITGLETVSALKPVTYKWNADDADGEGFIAHELQSVIPLAVTGEKDAVDDEGKPIHQGVDYSKIVVHLVSAVQQLKAELDALKGTK